MELYCTRPSCPRPRNIFPDLDDKNTLTNIPQKFCTSCGMPLILVGRYLPIRLLGQGGFGAAFLARDRYTPALRQCVVKQFLPSVNLNAAQLRVAQDLFAREAAVLEELGQQNDQIPDLFAFFPLSVPNSGGKPEEFFYLAQEFIDGEDLEQELETQGVFTEAKILEILESILPVLEFVHQQGVIHRDIKPSNIMRDRRGKLHLLDFGAVKQATAGTTPQGKSTGIYSLGFAPPEQMAGDQVFPATDLYAFAVTLLTLLTGKEPQELFDSYTSQWQWRKYAQVSDRLAAVLDKMLRPIPSERYPSAAAALQALQSSSNLTPKPISNFIGSSPAPIAPPINPPPPSQVSYSQPAYNQPSSTPPPPSVATTPKTSLQTQRIPRFSLIETLGNAAFVGFQSPLIFVVLSSFLPNPAISIGLGGMIVGGLVYLLYQRTIERWDLVIITGITLGAMLLFPGIRGIFSLQNVLFFSLMGGAACVAITTVFRLVYQIISRII